MVPGWGLLLVSLAYVGALFAIAWFGDRNTTYPSRGSLRPVVYSLALAVYCSSWTFYGAVGSAARDGASYLPIYIGPILLFLFGMPFFERLVRVAKRHNATSIADLIASRFGKSSRIAAAITLVALGACTAFDVEGILRKTTEVRPRIVEAFFRCPGGHITIREQGYGKFREPDGCATDGCTFKKLDLVPKRSKFVNSQKPRIQESPAGLRG